MIRRLRERLRRPLADSERRPVAIIACAVIVVMAVVFWMTSGGGSSAGTDAVTTDGAVTAPVQPSVPEVDVQSLPVGVAGTARGFAAAYLSADYRRPGAGVRRLARYATPRMHVEAARGMGSAAMRSTLRDRRTIVAVRPGTPRLDESASVDGDLWVMVPVSMRVSDAGRRYRQDGSLTLRMVSAGEGWLVEQVGQ